MTKQWRRYTVVLKCHWAMQSTTNLALADPAFTVPATIDLLLGADLFSQILNSKQMTVGSSYPAAFGTVFGWTVIGAVPHSMSHWPVSCPTSLTVSIETLLQKFWENEEPDTAPEEFTQEGKCASLFCEGCIQDSSGRFCVPLFLRRKIEDNEFRGSRAVAQKRFDHLERKLGAEDCLWKLYCDFMEEYLTLGHMSPTTTVRSYVIPHHAVYQSLDINPKIRVVFDASAPAYSGTSLNDHLLPGPKRQRDVVHVLLLYRVHRYAFTTDISKMYRQFLITPFMKWNKSLVIPV